MNCYNIDDMKRDLLEWDFTEKEIANMNAIEITAAWMALPAII